MASTPNLPAALSPPLSDRDAVADAIYRAVYGIDLNDAKLYNSAFTPDGILDLNGTVADIHTNCFDRVAKLNTTHFVTNLRINISEGGTCNKAQAIASFLAQHYPAGKGMEDDTRRLLAGGLYYVDAVRDESDGLWKIESFKVRTTWREGDWAVMRGD